MERHFIVSPCRLFHYAETKKNNNKINQNTFHNWKFSYSKCFVIILYQKYNNYETRFWKNRINQNSSYISCFLILHSLWWFCCQTYKVDGEILKEQDNICDWKYITKVKCPFLISSQDSFLLSYQSYTTCKQNIECTRLHPSIISNPSLRKKWYQNMYFTVLSWTFQYFMSSYDNHSYFSFSGMK